MKQLPFAITPYEVALDHRLTLIQTRVLIALLSFRDRDTNLAWPKREHLSERCGYGVNHVSRATRALVDLGWLHKVGNGGRGRPVRYRFMVPPAITRMAEEAIQRRAETVSESGRVSGRETVSESGRVSGRNGVRIGQGHRSDHQIPDQPAPPTATRERSADAEWDAMLSVCGIDPRTARPTRSERGAWNKALSDLRSTGEATPDEMHRRGQMFRRKFPSATLTPTALARRWTECSADTRSLHRPTPPASPSSTQPEPAKRSSPDSAARGMRMVRQALRPRAT